MADFFIWAHRGASATAPENTLAAFRAAEAAGAAGIELDVHLSADGVPVVIHDETVERTTDGRGPVAGLTLRQLRRLDAGSWFAPEFADATLPTLEEVFEWAASRLRLNLEIKAEAAGVAVLELLRRYPEACVLVSSFDHQLLERLRARCAELPLGFLSESPFWRRAVARAVRCGAASFHPRRDRLTRPMLEVCRRQGLAVFPWTVDSPREAAALRRLGAAGLFTNDPASLIRALRHR